MSAGKQELPEGWELVKLGDICDFIGGSQPPKSTFIYDLAGKNEAQYVRLLQIRDYKSSKYVVYIDKSKTKKFCNKNDVMIGRYGPPIFQILRGLEGAYNVALMKAVPKTNELSKDYLFNFLRTPRIQNFVISRSSRAAGQSGVNKQTLFDYPIPLPPLPEQRRIVAVLDECFAAIDKAIANTEQNLTNARELFESHLNQIFSQKGEDWEERTIDASCELISGQHIAADDYNTDGCGIGYLTGPSDFGHTHPNVSKWTESPKRTALQEDILITVKGSGVGKINLMNAKELAISRQLMAIRARNVETKYLYLFISQQFSYFQNLSNGAAIPGISRADVLNLKFSVPNADQQVEIVKKLETIEVKTQRLEAIYRRKLAALAELKQSLLQKAFAGELSSKTN